jgi:phage-related protein
VTQRKIFFYKEYFSEFYRELPAVAQKKVDYVIGLVASLPIVPESFFKHIEGANGLYEMRVAVGSNSYRIFCFFDEGHLVVVGNGFQKKTRKTPKNELERAIRIKKQYFDEKETSHNVRRSS